MGKTKKAGFLARAATCLVLSATMVFCTLLPSAYAAVDEPIIEDIRVTVPTKISCALMPDGTVVSPTNLSVENTSDIENIVMDVDVTDTYGNLVDFTLDADGKQVLMKGGGAVVTDWIDLATLSKVSLGLDVSKLTRQSNAALIDAASKGESDMFQLGFKFNLKRLLGSVAIFGKPTVGTELTADVRGPVQEDAQLAYQWYRDRHVEDVHMTTGMSGIYYEFDVDASGTKVHVEEPADAEDFNTDYRVRNSDGKWEFYYPAYDANGNAIFDETGHYAANITFLETRNPIPVKVVITSSELIVNETMQTHTVVEGDVGKHLFCKVTDASGKYKGTLTSDPFGPIANLPKKAFAVYSEDDQSLNFYKRTKVPAVGDTFEGKTVTNVYTGIEDGKITPAVNTFAGERPFIENSPFKEFRKITSVSFVDKISAPSSIESWFARFDNCTRGDFEKLDTSNVNTMYGLFAYSGFISLDLSSWNCKSVEGIYPSYMFYSCDNLRQVTVGDSCGRLVHNLPIRDVGGKWYNKSGIGFISNDIPTDVADTYTYRSTPPEPPKFTGSVTFSPQAEVAEDRQSTTINISYTYSPRDAVVGIVKYEVADDANGLNAREVAIDKNVLQEPVWGKYMRITIADTSGKYEGSVDSGWIGRMTTEFYGRAEITDTPQQGTRPGYRVTGPILIDGQSGLSCYDIRWEIADDANGLNARPHDELNAGRYLKTEDIGKYVRIVVSAKAPYSVHVPGSIASGWVEVRGHNGGDIMRADSSMVEQGDLAGKVLISSNGEASDE